jgi:Putative prokaryotic signal transducing protein
MVDFDNNEPTALETVFQSIDPVRVRMAYDLLQQGGIEAFIFDNESSRMLGSTSAIEARLMVHADSVEEARSRLRELGFTE